MSILVQRFKFITEDEKHRLFFNLCQDNKYYTFFVEEICPETDQVIRRDDYPGKNQWGIFENYLRHFIVANKVNSKITVEHDIGKVFIQPNEVEFALSEEVDIYGEKLKYQRIEI